MHTMNGKRMSAKKEVLSFTLDLIVDEDEDEDEPSLDDF